MTPTVHLSTDALQVETTPGTGIVTLAHTTPDGDVADLHLSPAQARELARALDWAAIDANRARVPDCDPSPAQFTAMGQIDQTNPAPATLPDADPTAQPATMPRTKSTPRPYAWIVALVAPATASLYLHGRNWQENALHADRYATEAGANRAASRALARERPAFRTLRIERIHQPPTGFVVVMTVTHPMTDHPPMIDPIRDHNGLPIVHPTRDAADAECGRLAQANAATPHDRTPAGWSGSFTVRPA